MILLGHRTAVSEIEKRHRRTNRRTYVVEILLIFGASLAVEFGLGRVGVPGLWVDIALTLPLLYLVARALSGRTHDLGRTDDWTLIPLVVFACGWLTVVFWQDAPLAVEVASHLAWSLALVSPVFVKGDKGENRFGSSPDEAVELNVIANAG